MDSNASQQIPFFVYGTLIPGQPNSYLWGKEVVSSQPAVFSGGALYDMGYFPMLVEEQGGDVRGMLIDVAEDAYQATLTRIDHLEGYNPNQPDNSTYKRLKRSVRLADGKLLHAWLYVGRVDFIKGLAKVPDGDWIAYSTGKETEMMEWWSSVGTVYNYRGE